MILQRCDVTDGLVKPSFLFTNGIHFYINTRIELTKDRNKLLKDELYIHAQDEHNILEIYILINLFCLTDVNQDELIKAQEKQIAEEVKSYVALIKV